MRVFKDITLALTFVAVLFGGGLSSGKEVATFLGDASILSITACGFIIGLTALPFLLLGRNTLEPISQTLFPYKPQVLDVLIGLINLIFLGAMFGGAEELLFQYFGFKGGSIITAIATFIVFYVGDRFIKYLCALSVPLTLIMLLLLFNIKGSAISGNFTIHRAIIYASMNSFCAGFFIVNFSKGISKKDCYLISLIIAVLLSALLLLTRSTIIGAEEQSIPLLFVAQDTDFAILGFIVIFISIFTSAVSSLKLTTTSLPISPFITVCMALAFSFLGFKKIVEYLYPVIGIVGLSIIAILTYRLITDFIKKKKSEDCTCNGT